MAILVDAFTGTSGSTLDTHVADTPGSAVWKKVGGVNTNNNLVISDSNRVRTTVSTLTAYYADVVAAADGDVEVDIYPLSTATGSLGVTARNSKTDQTFYLWRYSKTASVSQVQMFKFNAGTATQLGTFDFTPTIGTAFRIRISPRGNVIKGYLDGVERVSVTDSSITAAGPPGLYSNQSQASNTSGYHFDNASASDGAATAPANTAAPVVSGTAAVGSVLSTTTGTWTGSPTPTFTYQWQRDGVNLSGATGSTYTVVSADAGHDLRCVVTGTNSAGSNSANSNTVSIPAAPVNTVAPAITTDGSPSTGETVSVNTGTWTGANITYTYQWYRGASPITDQTANTYTLAVTDEGASITCRVTATNGGGASTANSNAITPAVTAGISDASFLNYYSGGTDNTNPAQSIGGARGGTYPGTIDALFGKIPGSVAQAGGTFYAGVYVRNTHSSATAYSMKAYIENQFTATGLTMAVAVPVEAAGTNLPALASRTTPPSGVTFTTTTDPAAGSDFGNLGPGAQRGLWVRLDIAAGTPKVDQADAGWNVRGTS